MALPITFSPSGTEYLPSPEDALRTGVMLMFLADDVTRKDLSFDATDPAKGVRIYAGQWPAGEGPPKSWKMILPQLHISSPFGQTRWSYATSNSGEKRIVIAVTLYEPQDSSKIDTDPAAPEITPEMKFARFERVLMCGTLYQEGQTSNAAKVVDPYRSGKLVNGQYDPAAIKFLNALAPDITRQVSIIGELAVAYSLIAVYTVDVSNREVMTEAGF